MHSQVLLGHIGIISSYLPDSRKPLCLYAAALSELQEALDMLINKGARWIVIGGDLQIEVQSDIIAQDPQPQVEEHAMIIGTGITFF